MKLPLGRVEVSDMMQHYAFAAAAACLLTGSLFAVHGAVDPNATPKDIQNQVRSKLGNLPYYGVFDNIAFQVNGTQVTLMGQVVTPVLKDDAANAVKGVAGVTSVTNEIEVLPPSDMDMALRRAIFRAIYNDPAMTRYAMEPVPSIHIIVKNGNVTLIGVVASQTDGNIAYVRANSVPGAFAVNNDLQVDPGL